MKYENLERDELHYEDDPESVDSTYGPMVTLVQTVKDGDHGKMIIERRMRAFWATLALDNDENGKSILSAHIDWGKHSDVWTRSI